MDAVECVTKWLHLAAQHGYEATVRALLDAAPDAATAADHEGWLPLHVAASHGHEAIVRLLLDAAPHTATAADEDGGLPLHCAASNGHEAIVRLLLDAAPHTATAAMEDGTLPLHCAASYGHEAIVRLLLDAAPHTATAATHDGHLPLHCAAVASDVTGRYDREAAALVRVLLDAAPHTATATASDGRVPLQHALRCGCAAVARLLLAAGPASDVLRHLAEAGDVGLELFADFVATPDRLPLTAADWDLVPTPCPGIERCLAAAYGSGTAQAAHVVRRMQPADAARLRCAALCLHHHVPPEVAALILMRCA
jgi:ankyrin repeat protein